MKGRSTVQKGRSTEGRKGGKIVLIIGHEGKTVQREGKVGRMY